MAVVNSCWKMFGLFLSTDVTPSLGNPVNSWVSRDDRQVVMVFRKGAHRLLQ